MTTSQRERREEQLHIRMRLGERQELRELAALEGRTASAFVREAIAAKRAAQSERWGPRLFGTEEPPTEAA